MPSYVIQVSNLRTPYSGIVFSRSVSPPSREKLLSLVLQPRGRGETGSIEIIEVNVDGQNILTDKAKFHAAFHTSHHVNRLSLLTGIEYVKGLEVSGEIHGPQGGMVTVLGVVEMHSQVVSAELRFIRRVDDVNEIWEVIHKTPEGKVLHRGIIVRADSPNKPMYKYSVWARLLGGSVWEHVTTLSSDSQLNGEQIQALKKRYAARLGLEPQDIDIRLVEVLEE